MVRLYEDVIMFLGLFSKWCASQSQQLPQENFLYYECEEIHSRALLRTPQPEKKLKKLSIKIILSNLCDLRNQRPRHGANRPTYLNRLEVVDK